jgi:ADP-ribose pyrophosphatase YjhB (NUDIX family)
MSTIWKPSVTVAAIIERDGKFLLVEEETSDGIRFNQPAGHLDPDESLIDAVSREALEETSFDFFARGISRRVYVALCLKPHQRRSHLLAICIYGQFRQTT